MSTNDKRCFKCKEEVSSGQYIAVGSYFYHPNCFVCRHCSSPIKGNYVDHRETNFPYHPECMEKVDEQQAMSQGKVCQSCQKACFRGKYLTLTNGTMYHSQCFVCADCKHPITGSYLSYGTEKVPLHETCARKRDNATAITEGKICKKCGKPCVVGQIMTLSTGEMYHARCFTCIQCKKTIEGKFAQHGTNNQPFHLECLEAIQNKLTISTSSTNRLHNDSSNTTIGAQGKVEKEKARLCKKCNLACTTGQFYSTASAIYHADCFRCSDPSCNGLITGKYTDYGEPPLPYHPACGKELFSPRYTLCTSTMEGQYFRHPYFESEIYCMSHESVPSCFACSRKEPLPSSRREGFVDLMDGRSLCVQCSSSIIVDSSEAQALYLGIVDFMGRELGLPIPPEMRDVPVLLVDIQSLNESRSRLGDVLGHHNTAAEAEGEISAVSPAAKNPEETGGSAKASACPIGASVEAAQQLIQQRAESRSSKSAVRHTGSEGIIRGATLSTCAQVKYLPSTGLQFDHSRKSMVARPQAPEIYHMKQVRDVTAVLVLYGLPRDLMASILAHEAMHVWLKLNKDFPFRMPPKLEEGLCQVISYLYLESLVAKTTDQAGEAAAPAVDVTPASAHQNMVASAPGGVVRKGGAIAVASANGAAVAGAKHLVENNRPGSRPSSAAAARKGQNKRNVKSLAAWFKQQIVLDKSPIYGQGFKEVNKHVSLLGLQAVLDYIKRHKALPNRS